MENALVSVAFVTGGAQGIGAAVVQKLLSEGHQVGSVDAYASNHGDPGLRQKLRLGERRAVSGEAYFDSDSLLIIQGDVRDTHVLEQAVAQTQQHFGEIDILVANAGIFMHKDLLQTSETDWDDIMGVNLKGAAFAARAVLPSMIERKQGSIVFIASDQCFFAKQHCPAYAASKAALGQLAKNLAIDYAEHNVRVNAVCPGSTDTPMLRKLITEWEQSPEEVIAHIQSEMLLGRLAQPEEIAELVYFLASPKASFITGALYAIDGGHQIDPKLC